MKPIAIKIVALNLFCLVFLTGTVCAQAESAFRWQGGRSFRGIQVFTREKVSSDRKDIKAVTKIKASQAVILDAVRDIKQFKSWMFRLKSIEAIQSPDSPETIYYFLWQIPYPFEDRDAITVRKEEPGPEPGSAVVRYISYKDVIPENEKRVRMRDFECALEISPLSDKETKVSLLIKMDPKGTLPPGVANLLAEAITYKSLSNLRKYIQKSTQKPLFSRQAK